jgi:hypothetical protein
MSGSASVTALLVLLVLLTSLAALLMAQLMWSTRAFGLRPILPWIQVLTALPSSLEELCSLMMISLSLSPVTYSLYTLPVAEVQDFIVFVAGGGSAVAATWAHERTLAPPSEFVVLLVGVSCSSALSRAFVSCSSWLVCCCWVWLISFSLVSHWTPEWLKNFATKASMDLHTGSSLLPGTLAPIRVCIVFCRILAPFPSWWACADILVSILPMIGHSRAGGLATVASRPAAERARNHVFHPLTAARVPSGAKPRVFGRGTSYVSKDINYELVGSELDEYFQRFCSDLFFFFFALATINADCGLPPALVDVSTKSVVPRPESSRSTTALSERQILLSVTLPQMNSAKSRFPELQFTLDIKRLTKLPELP